jgi:dTDP-4-dehydrorhamnose 3,5-epimerase-like enzyme
MYKGDIAVDDRGKVTFVNDFNFEDVKRFYMVENHSKGFIRAWHGHKKEAKYVFVVSGAIILAILPIDDTKPSVERYVLSADKPQVFHIPAGYYNGFKTLTDDTKVIFYSTATLEESKTDDERLYANIKSDIWDVIER